MRSPDLNPIENVWNALGRQFAGRNYPPANNYTLIRELTEEWDKLPQQLLDNVVQTLVRPWLLESCLRSCEAGVYVTPLKCTCRHFKTLCSFVMNGLPAIDVQLLFLNAPAAHLLMGVVVRREGVPAQVPSMSLGHGSELRGPSPKALE
ncbi:hypothetical protein TNCV_303341 [Trichonephila clavipes]|nr:hypothetical protein TNCV_303341 [Trichonephila clavipes]